MLNQFINSSKFYFRLRASFLSVLVIVQGLLICLSIIFTRIIIKSLNDHDIEKTEKIAAYVSNQIQQDTAIPELAALSIANNAGLAELFRHQKFDKLKTEADSIWTKLAPQGLSQFSFFLPTKNAILAYYKAHQPEVHGEAISASRIMVTKCVEDKKLISGLEQGKSGYGFRAVTPVYVGNDFVGCVEFGAKFGEGFLKKLDSFSPGNWSMVNLSKGVQLAEAASPVMATYSQSPSSSSPVIASPAILSVLNEKKIFYQRNQSSETVSLYIPVQNFSGQNSLYIINEFKTDYFEKMRSAVVSSIAISLIGLMLSGVIIFLLYQQITHPLAGLVLETEKIRNFQLDDPVKIPAKLTEIENLVAAVTNMKTGLKSFQKYVPAQLVRQLIQSGEEATVHGHKKDLSILFSDIADFTSISEKLSATELTLQLSEYLNEMSQIIIAELGTVDKYIGDAVMAFWGAPIENHHHALAACTAALKMRSKILALNTSWQQQGKPEFKTRIGINTGEVIVGNIGSEQRLSYTVIGDSVNLASRLEGINKNYHTSIIISDQTYRVVSSQVLAKALDFVLVKGKTQPVMIFELIDLRAQADSLLVEKIDQYNAAAYAMSRSEYAQALDTFKGLSAKFSGDQHFELLKTKCEQELNSKS